MDVLDDAQKHLDLADRITKLERLLDGMITQRMKDQAEMADMYYRLVEQRWLIIHHNIHSRLVEIGFDASVPPREDQSTQNTVIRALNELRTRYVWFIGAFEHTDNPRSVFNRWLQGLETGLTPYSDALGERLVDSGLLLPDESEFEED